MLPFNIKIVQEGKADVSVDSSIRFQRFDNCSFGQGKPLYEFSPLIVSATKFSGAFGDGEISFIRTSHAVAVSERCGENIKTTSNGVDISASFNIECEREWRFLDYYQRIIRRIRAVIFEDYIQIVFNEGIEPFFEGWEIGYGPVNGCLSI